MVPSKYFSKTTEILNAADGRKLVVNYKLKNTAVCNKCTCLDMPFIMVKSLSHNVILGNPFLHLLYPITKISKEGIASAINNQELTLKFVSQQQHHKIDIIQKSIKRRENFLNSLSQEINYKRVKENYCNRVYNKRLKIYKTILRKLFVQTLLMPFGRGKNLK